jgi:azurin
MYKSPKMKQNLSIAGLFALILLSVYGCSGTDQQNRLSDQEEKDGWTLLFDGKTMTGWHLFNKGTIPSAWSVDSGRLICNPHAKEVKHGDLVTDKVYQNFDLRFEWKISRAGNSGLFINVQERPELATTFATGPEYQLLDDRNMEPDYLKNPSHKAAAIFGVVPNNSHSIPKTGEWNQSRILQQNGKLTFWLNDAQTVQVDLQSAAWKNLVTLSSLSKYPEFGVATSGHLAVQDWTNGIAFRNIKIKELSKADQPAESETMERTIPGVEKLEFTDTMTLQANENMRFDKDLFKIKTGKKIRLLFRNTGVPSNTAMAHNVVILMKGTDIADFADAVHTAKNEQYVPSSVGSLVIAHTKLVSGGDSDALDFTISQPGIYDYICSFPGHWGTMQGKIVAE